MQLPQALRSRVICGFLEHCGVREPESAHIRRVDELLASDNPSAWAVFPGGITLRREYERLVKSEDAPALTARPLACPGATDLPELGLRVVCRVAETLDNSHVCFTVAPQGELWVRSRQAGDRLRLPGGSRSLKKLFIDRRIPAGDRDRIPVVADSQGVLGVWGIGPNQDRVSKEIPAVQICFEKI